MLSNLGRGGNGVRRAHIVRWGTRCFADSSSKQMVQRLVRAINHTFYCLTYFVTVSASFLVFPVNFCINLSSSKHSLKRATRRCRFSTQPHRNASSTLFENYIDAFTVCICNSPAFSKLGGYDFRI